MASLKNNELTFPDTNCGVKVIEGNLQSSISFSLSKNSWCAGIVVANIANYGNSIFTLNLRNNEVSLVALIPNATDPITESVSNGVITLSLANGYYWDRAIILYT